MVKKSKGVMLTITVIALLLIGGGYYLLMKKNIFPVPGILQSLPIINRYLPDTGTAKTGVEKTPQENDTVKKNLDVKEKEIQSLQAQVAYMRKQLENSDQTTVAGTSAQNGAVTTPPINSGKSQSVYKDVALYYAEMKAKNAADLLSSLSDEDIIGILSNLPKDTAAEILQNMDANKAAAITKKMLATAP